MHFAVLGYKVLTRVYKEVLITTTYKVLIIEWE